MSDVIRIANCSGFYGDRLDAAREMVEGGPIDVLTGDYLAELTMSILYSQQQTRGEDMGYVGTFLKQNPALSQGLTQFADSALLFKRGNGVAAHTCAKAWWAV